MKTKKRFEVEIEAKLIVEAFDEQTARKKAEAVVTSQRALGPDVRATGHGWTYAVTRQPAD